MVNQISGIAEDESLIISRIQAKALKYQDSTLRSEIIADTTPVPFFGDFRNAEIVSIGLNPSSNEFPTKKSNRRLIHLSDLDISPEYFQQGMGNMTENQASKILEQCVKYFELNSYKWFDTASVALNIGFEASYYRKVSSKILACHTDIFPWATRAFSTLDSKLQRSFKEENYEFLSWFLQREKMKSLVILGKSTWHEIQGIIKFEPISKKPANFEQAANFEYGSFEINGISKPYFYSSKGPSSRGSDAEKLKIHELFGQFIKTSRNSHNFTEIN